MQLPEIPQSVFLPQPPPLWYVTDGERSVGPIITGQLVRHVEAGQVPDYCHVRMMRSNWRQVNLVREVAAVQSRMSRLPKAALQEAFLEFTNQVGCVRDEDEFLHEMTAAALEIVGAESAMLHCAERSTRAMVTRSIVGPMPMERLGYPLPESDLVLRAARLRRPVIGPPYGPTEDALAMRFASSHGGVGAVAMIPIAFRGDVHIMLELARPGHAFRRTDLQRAERLVQRTLRLRAN